MPRAHAYSARVRQQSRFVGLGGQGRARLTVRRGGVSLVSDEGRRTTARVPRTATALCQPISVHQQQRRTLQSSMRSAALSALAGGDASASVPGSRERFRALRSASPRGRLAAGASADSSACFRTAAPAGGSASAGDVAGSRGGKERIRASTRAALPKGVGRPHSGRAMDARCVSLRGKSTSCATLSHVEDCSVGLRATAPSRLGSNAGGPLACLAGKGGGAHLGP